MKRSRFADLLLAWYAENRRDLPWRRTSNPYRIWISEVMAQQTQLDRVVLYYEQWMERFPDLCSLAAADLDEVLKCWEGLGYYSRARNLQAAAQKIVDEFNGEFPRCYDDVLSLPGVGPYTAGAIASIAFGLPVPAIDANALRVFARILDLELPARDALLRRQVTQHIEEVLPSDRAGDFNQAVMELGALVCSRSPACDRCPVRALCAAHRNGTMAERPVPVAMREKIKLTVATGVLMHNGRVLIQKRRPDDAWPNLWEFPGGVVEPGETPEQAVVREYQEEVELAVRPVRKIAVIQHSYTNHQVTLHGFYCELLSGNRPRPVFNAAVSGCFVEPLELADYAFPAGHRKLIACILSAAK